MGLEGVAEPVFRVSERWGDVHAHAMVGVLVVRDAVNVRQHAALESAKRALEAALRCRFTSPEAIRSDETIQAYTRYYRRFEKTYHLAQQLKTLVVKQVPLPVVSGLVDVMFLAEMKNLLLTAGHDLATVVGPVAAEVATGVEEYMKLSQEPQRAKSGDMMVVDQQGILSSVIHGPDFRSRITAHTRDALYVVYAPEGILRDAVLRHFGDIRQGVRLFSPSAAFEPVRLLSARGVEVVTG